MDIQEVFWKENSKEQSDKSTGEESDTDGSLSRADKSKTYMTCSISNKLSENRRRNVTRKIKATRKLGRTFNHGCSVKILNLASFLLMIRSGEGNLKCNIWCRQQGDLLTGTMPQNY